MSKYLDENGLLYFWQHIKSLFGNKVDKVQGMGLSTNDYTNADVLKLASIASGAEVNVIESVLVNGVAAPISLKAAAVTVPTKTSDLTNDSDFITSADLPDISGVYTYKGSVATYAQLPSTGQVKGDVWNVESDGMNYAWTGTAWDSLGGSFSITSITNGEIDVILAS